MMEVFIPRKRIVVNDMAEANEYRLLYSGKKDVYLSVYRYDKEIDIHNVIIDKIFLDFDYDKELVFFDNVRQVAKFLFDSDYLFNIRFSGRGFHIFVQIDENVKLKNPKKAIRKWVKDMHKKTNTTSDFAVVGDLRRVSRMLGSMNLKTHLYCIPIEYSELMNFTYEGICEIAKEMKQKYYDDIYCTGKKLLDISNFDTENKTQNINYNIDINNIKIQNDYPPCINSMLKNPELGYWERGQLIIFLRDSGYGFEEILTILQSVLSEDKYNHCVIEEGQPSYLYYIREDILFASCQTLDERGFCPSSTCSGCSLYL